MTMTNESSGNPYVGPQTFTEAQGHLFFGREREANELCARVLSERLVLFYAQSGAGKSSLINARLIPQLRELGYAVLPVARVSGELPSGVTEVDNVFLLNLMLSLDSSRRDPGRFAHMPLPQFMAGLSSDDGKRYVYEEATQPAQQTETPPPSVIPYVLIIDQFEELITTNADHWRKREEFFVQLNKAMADDPKLWVLLSFREDYVAPIETYASLMRDRMRARFYMERMGIEAGLDAVQRPAELGGRPFAPRAAERLVEDLRQVRVSGQEATVAGPYVEPVQLQVVCYQLWKNIENENRPPGPITIDDVVNAGDVNKALINFYEEVLASVLASSAEPVTQRRLRTWFEQELITPDGTRGLVRQGEDTTGDLPNAIVAELQRRFLVRSDTRSGDTRIEIVHDRFVEPILASNRAWRAQNQNPLVLAADVWLAENKNPRRLLSGEQLRSAEAQLDVARNELNEEELRKVMVLLEASKTQERQRTELLSAQRMAILEPQKYISEMGWGVIFPAVPRSEVEKQKGIDAIKEALQPLLDHRKAEATLRRKELYREFIVDGKGYRRGETADQFLARNDVDTGKVDPSLMPYYLLLVGDPEAIPFEFQYQLDVQYAVGRICFDSLEEYRRYAESVVRAEGGAATRARRIGLFAPLHPDDQGTHEIRKYLVEPLLERLENEKPDWSLSAVLGNDATKARLSQLLGGEETPALFFDTSHGVAFKKDSPFQLSYQGALLCQDWPGPLQWKGDLPAEFYFAANDLADRAGVFGVIAFAFTDYGAGTPRFDDFFHITSVGKEASSRLRSTIAERAFVSRLPQRLLSHPQGGMLAFIGHVERIWSYTWRPPSRPGGIFAAVLERLLDGYPVGAALEPFNQRYAALAAWLSEALYQDQVEQGKERDPFDIAHMWTAAIDARNWIVIGDPAVRLMVSGLRPDMAGLRLLYKVENLRSEGDELAVAGDLVGAGAKYQEVLELNPWLGIDPATEARAVAARTQIRKAKELAMGGKIEVAVALFEEAQRLNPDLGLESMKEVRRLVAPYFLDKGRAAASAGKYKSALGLFGRAAELDPILGVNPGAEASRLVALHHRDQGRKLAKEGNVGAAISHYKKARKFDPALKSEFDSTEALEPRTEAGRYAAQFFVEQGTKLAEQGDREQAAASFRKAVELNPLLLEEWEPEKKAAQLVARYQSDKERAALRPQKDEKLSGPGTPESDQMLWFNGVNAATGEYLMPPMVAQELVWLIRGEKSPDYLQELRTRWQITSSKNL